MGEMNLTTHGLRVFSGSVRQEIETPMGQMVMVLTPDDAFVATPQGTRAMPGSRAESMRENLWRDPVSLLKAWVERKDREGGEATVSAAAAGAETEGDTTVDLVEMEVDGVVTTLAIDRQSGHVVELRYQGTGPQGAPGSMRDTYSDFRDVDGLVYPFSTVSTFEGDQVGSVTVQSLEVNPETPAGTFDRPSGGQ